MTTASAAITGTRIVEPVRDAASARAFTAAGAGPYATDPHWTPPLPGEERDTFDPRRNPTLSRAAARRWVLTERGTPVGRIAAFVPEYQPGEGYFGFFECPQSPSAAVALLRAAEEWLGAAGCRTAHGPIAVTARDRIGLLVEGFERPAVLFTPYNPPYYAALLEAAGYSPGVWLRAYGWESSYDDPRGVIPLAEGAVDKSSFRIRHLDLARLSDETRLIARLINETLAEAWHFDPIDEQEALQLAALLRPIVDPEIALVAEDAAGPCGVALAVPDVNWLWRRAGGRLWPLGWARLLRWRRRIPQARLMALGVEPRVRGTSVAARLIATLVRTGRRRYVRGELSQVFDDNVAMRRVLEHMQLPVVRRYAVFSRTLEH